MAERPVFISSIKEKRFVKTQNIKFEWFPGFSINQKQKSIESFHNNIQIMFPSLNVLEISTKSNKELGIALSAFNLTIKTKKNLEFSVETAFQASKVFENGGPFLDLYKKTSKEAKKDQRLKTSGELLYFQFFERRWSLEPKTFFYDWLYVNALFLNEKLGKEVLRYDAFTDIEFNPKTSINCQARSVSLYVSLYKSGMLEEALSSINKFEEIAFGEYQTSKSISETREDMSKKEEFKQLSFFDKLDL